MKPTGEVTTQDPWSNDLRAVYGASAEGLTRLAAMLLGTRAEGEEVVHDAFLAVADRGDDVDDLGPYVRRAVVNRCYGVLRRRQVAERHPVDPAPPEAPRHLVEFRDVLLALPWHQRAVVVLRYLEGLSVAETAALVDCPESTVRSHARRGLAALRKELES